MSAYTTEQLYGTSLKGILTGEIPYLEKRISILEDNLTKENDKHWRDRDSHLVTKIKEAQRFYEARIKEIR